MRSAAMRSNSARLMTDEKSCSGIGSLGSEADGQNCKRGGHERAGHEEEHDRQPGGVAERGYDGTVQRHPQRADTEGEREVQAERRVTQVRRRDVRQERLQLRTLDEVEDAQEEDRYPQ